jgi:transposase
MSGSRRRFTAEYKIEAAHRVIDSGRSIAEVARELSLNEVTLGNWVREERRRLAALEGTDAPPLSAAERAELQRLRKQVAEQEKDTAFLGTAAAYFASNPPKQSGSH